MSLGAEQDLGSASPSSPPQSFTSRNSESQATASVATAFCFVITLLCKHCFLRKGISETSHFRQPSPSRCQDRARPEGLCRLSRDMSIPEHFKSHIIGFFFNSRGRICPLVFNSTWNYPHVSPLILHSHRQTRRCSLPFHSRTTSAKESPGLAFFLLHVLDNCFSSILKYSPRLYSLMPPV